MFYILDELSYIEEVSTHYIERDNKTCTEYTGAIPEGYETYDEWALNANIRAYKLDANGNLMFDADRNAALQEEYKKKCFVDNQIYSTEEKIIGTYIDGKPIYRITIVGTTGATSGTVNTTILLKNKVCDRLLKYYGHVILENTKWSIPASEINGATPVRMYNNGEILGLQINKDYISLPLEITLEYTKTTD
jgi:hypothetical protein